MGLTTRTGGEWLGRTASREVTISEGMLDEFARLSGDTSPIHMTAEAARSRGFRGRVAHGALLLSLVSGLVGTALPGEDGVLQDIQCAFRSPCHPGDVLTISLTVSEFYESVQAMTLSVRITRADGVLLATGKAQSGLRAAGR